MTRVSIFLSSYNYAAYLRDAIESVLNQSYADFELFIQDDASSDESWAIIQSYADLRIRSFQNPTNRNDKEGMKKVIMEMAAGEYIAVHHSDNIWEPGKLQKQVDFLDSHPDTGAVFTNALIIGENGEPLNNELHPYFNVFDQPNRCRQDWLNHFFYLGNALCHPSVLIRKECYDQCGFYRSGLTQFPDLDMWVRLCLKYEIHVLPEKLVKFRVRLDERSISGDRPETRIRSYYEMLQVLQNYLAIPDFEELVRIFPAAREYYLEDGYDIGYILGRLSLDPADKPYKHLFGLNTLFPKPQ